MTDNNIEGIFNVLSHHNDYINIEACISGINNFIFASSKEQPEEPHRKEYISSMFSSIITSMCTPMFATATDSTKTNQISKDQFVRTINILQEDKITKDSSMNDANQSLFRILDIENKHEIPTPIIIDFITRLSNQNATDEAKEECRKQIDPMNKGKLTMDEFTKVMDR